jgi:hypothetical protein
MCPIRALATSSSLGHGIASDKHRLLNLKYYEKDNHFWHSVLYQNI